MNWLKEKIEYALTYSAPRGFGVNAKVLHPIAKKLIKTDGICPCYHAEWTDSTPVADKLCPCKTFRDSGDCHCGLYVKLHLKE